MKEKLPSPGRSSRAPLLAVLAALALCIVVLIVILATRRPPVVVNPEPKPAPVTTIRIGPVPLADSITLPARIEPCAELNLSSEKAGRVTEVLARKGDAVEAGAVMMRIDDRIWRVMQERAAIEKRDADRELARWQSLKKSGSVSDREFDSVQTRADMAAAALKEAGIHADNCELRSPVNGVVVDRWIEEGERVNEGDRVFKVISTGTVKVVMDVPEKQSGWARNGMPLCFTVAVFPSEVFTGTVSFVSALGDRQSNSFRTEVLAGNEDGRLKPGMLADARLTFESGRQALMVPLAAVVPKRDAHAVYVVAGDKAAERTVRIESFVGQSAVIAGGLTPGEEIVVEGARTLASGSRIERKEPEAP